MCVCVCVRAALCGRGYFSWDWTADGAIFHSNGALDHRPRQDPARDRPAPLNHQKESLKNLPVNLPVNLLTVLYRLTSSLAANVD